MLSSSYIKDITSNNVFVIYMNIIYLRLTEKLYKIIKYLRLKKKIGLKYIVESRY